MQPTPDQPAQQAPQQPAKRPHGPDASRTPAPLAAVVGVVLAGALIGVGAVLYINRGDDQTVTADGEQIVTESGSSTTELPASTTSTRPDTEAGSETTSAPSETTEATIATTSTSSSTSTSASSTSTTPTTLGPVPQPLVLADGVLVGWWDGGEWRSPPGGEEVLFDGAAPPPPVTPIVEFVGLDGSSDRRTLGEIGEECTEIGNSWSYGDSSESQNRIGVAADWPAQPRGVREVSATDAHVGVVRAILVQNKLVDPEIRITRVTEVDVDGDGTNEVIIEASKTSGSDLQLLGLPEGDYSVVVVARETGSGLEGAVVSLSVVDAESASQESFGGFLELSVVGGVADLNGDGSFELVTHYRYYEGGGTLIHTLGQEPMAVAGAGCGV